MSETEKQIAEYARQAKQAYNRKYREQHADKVEQWQINNVLSQYKKLIIKCPELFIEREDIISD